MVRFALTFFLLFYTSSLVGQTKTKWEDVKVFAFEVRGVPDSLKICGGEFFVDARATNMNELDEKELRTIKQKVAEYGCPIVFVDVKRVHTPVKGQLYILGLRRKED